MGRTCDYSDTTASPTPEDFQYLRQKVQELEERLQNQSRHTSVPRSITMTDDAGGVAIGGNSIPSIYAPFLFLDSDAYEFGRFTIPKARMPISPEILEALGDITEVQGIVETYFLTAHTWMPIVSKKRLYQQLMNPLAEQNADFALLYLCMKLIIQHPPEPPATVQTPLYVIAKRLYFLVETSGVYSIPLLQAGVLISLYELGHAIYPAAYLSIGQCARLGHALGIHGKDVPQMLPKVGTWTELEERRRVWWAVVVLERFVNLGGKGHPLSTEDASRDTYLPANDSIWDSGVSVFSSGSTSSAHKLPQEMVTNEPLLISSSASVQAGNFARLAQASHLLGCVIRHTNDLPTDIPFRLEEARQLDRTIRALYKLLPGKSADDSIGACTPLAVCFSAIMTLYDPYTCQTPGQTPDELSHTVEAVQGLKNISEEVARLSHDKLAAIEYGLDQTSPLILDCVYQAAASYAWMVRETGEAEYVEKARVLRRVFEVVGRRWRAAAEYLRILEATDRELAGL
ncbi:hypothetical protein FGG08_002969 [Glutinoglossum americanum]|uniref:Xylanolytic transcriptional activator regulatory domain-containing protein n=1 Tax=Glutinoglossum americanum TaxID=1670608 RepID=A0A9P8KYN0_9PEZI|nr:hypothetical protein FGG08_002969 [Glutinoglossum americanum]